MQLPNGLFRRVGLRCWGILASIALLAALSCGGGETDEQAGTASEPEPTPLETVVELQSADDYMSSYSDFWGSEFSGCVLLSKPESTEGGRRVSILKWPEGALLNLG